MKSKLPIAFIMLSVQLSVYAQNKGQFSGSLESTTHYYINDNILDIPAPQDRFASNNYLWVQYLNGPFSAGFQYEAYMPPLQGYAYQLEGNYIPFWFARFNKGIIDVTAGNFYEQFGSGLSFRSYEDRALGLNNAIEGVRLIFKPSDWISIKTIYGKPRRFDENIDSYIRGIDGEVNIGSLLKSEASIALGTGLVSRYQEYTGPATDFPATVNALNSRISIDLANFAFYTEYVHKSNDPDAMNLFESVIGHAITINSSYTSRGFGLFIQSRFLNNMNFQSDREDSDGYSGVNYLPSNTRQYTYLLSNLYPYSTQANEESSIQADLTYTLPGKTRLGGKYGTTLRFNYSLSGGLATGSSGDNITLSFGNTKNYEDINIEITRRWNSWFKSNMALQKIYYNKGVIEGGSDEIIESKIIIADLQARFTRRVTLRVEMQHLWSEEDNGNWAAVLTEISFAPNWSLFLSDMTDYENSEQVHYFNYGLGYSTNYFRIGFGYGRNREGYTCSGGVCRKVPAYKGFSVSLTSSF